MFQFLKNFLVVSLFLILLISCTITSTNKADVMSFYKDRITEAMFLENGTVLLHNENHISLFDSKTFEEIHTIKNRFVTEDKTSDFVINTVIPSPTNDLIAVRYWNPIQNGLVDDIVDIIELDSYKNIATIQDVFKIEFKPQSNSFITENNNWHTLSWDMNNGMLSSETINKSGPFLTFTPDGELYVTRETEGFALWKTQTNEQVKIFTENARIVAISKKGDLIATYSITNQSNFTSLEQIKLWRLENNELLKVLYESVRSDEFYYPQIEALLFTNNDKNIVGLSSEGISAWNIEDGKAIYGKGTTHHAYRDNLIKFDPSDQTFTYPIGEILVANLATGNTLFSLQESNQNTFSINYNSVGSLIISAHNKGIVKIWDTSNGSIVHTLSPK